MDPKLERLLARPIAQHCVEETHDGSLQADVLSVRPCRPIQVVDNRLEPGPLPCKPLEVVDAVEDLPVPAWDETHRSQDLQHVDLTLDWLTSDRRGYRVEGGGVSQHVCSPSCVVHEGLDAGDDERVGRRLWRAGQDILFW